MINSKTMKICMKTYENVVSIRENTVKNEFNLNPSYFVDIHIHSSDRRWNSPFIFFL